ncbi:MAG: glycosyltransferase family 4 protein [bacterium]|nr:glycosyltransferase family 4 protein [bacterium]
MNKKVLFVYRTARGKVYKDWQKGKSPDTLLYGANHLKKFGYQVDFIDTSYSPLNLFHPLFYPLEHAVIAKVGMGFKIDQAIILLPKFKDYDLIVSASDSAGLPILTLKYLGLINKPVIHMTSGLAGALRNKTNTAIFKFYKKILPYADVFTAYSKVEIDFFEERMGIKKGKIKYIPLGVDFNYFSRKSNLKKTIICAIGSDSCRDYETFFEAIRNIDIKVEVVCYYDNIRNLDIPPNVKIHMNIPIKMVREIYRKSLISVIPSYEKYRSTGQIVLLESAAAGLPIITSKVEGITSAFKFEDKKNLLYTRIEDPQDLRKKIVYLLKNPGFASKIGQNASRFVKNHYTTYNLAEQLSKFIDNL